MLIEHSHLIMKRTLLVLFLTFLSLTACKKNQDEIEVKTIAKAEVKTKATAEVETKATAEVENFKEHSYRQKIR